MRIDRTSRLARAGRARDRSRSTRSTTRLPTASASGLRISARSTDGVIEGIEDPRAHFHVGVQWHAECLTDRPEHLALFEGLVQRRRPSGAQSGMTLPDWAAWSADPRLPPYTVGLEEEVMLLDPRRLTLEHRIDDVLAELTPWLAAHVGAETHGCTLELATGVCETVGDAVAELVGPARPARRTSCTRSGCAPPSRARIRRRSWHDIRVSAGARYQLLSQSLRELARREPTFALHVHVGIPDPELAVRVADRLRAHVPLILALSANSPYWQGRDSGMASARTPLFQAFPRVGIPRQFGTYQRYVEAIDVLIRGGAIPEPTFVWWDVRLQPRFGTVEIRIADAQTRVEDTAAIVALVQAVAKLEAEEDFAAERLLGRRRGPRREPLPRRPRRHGGQAGRPA